MTPLAKVISHTIMYHFSALVFLDDNKQVTIYIRHSQSRNYHYYTDTYNSVIVSTQFFLYVPYQNISDI
jgi:hypothetical protein